MGRRGGGGDEAAGGAVGAKAGYEGLKKGGFQLLRQPTLSVVPVEADLRHGRRL